MAQKSKNEGIHYSLTGSGPTIVLLPGLGHCANIFDPLATDLQGRFSVVGISLPGSGKSPHIEEGTTIADMALKVAGLLFENSVSPVAIVGHSMGGFVALQMALEHFGLVKKVVLISSAAAGTQASFPFVTAGTAQDVVRENLRLSMAPSFPTSHRDKFENAVQATFANLGTGKGFIRQAAAAKAFDVRPRLKDINCPILVMHGDEDTIVKTSIAQDMAKSIRGSQFVLFRGVGHMPHIESVSEVASRMQAFLESCQ